MWATVSRALVSVDFLAWHPSPLSPAKIYDFGEWQNAVMLLQRLFDNITRIPETSVVTAFAV